MEKCFIAYRCSPMAPNADITDIVGVIVGEAAARQWKDSPDPDGREREIDEVPIISTDAKS